MIPGRALLATGLLAAAACGGGGGDDQAASCADRLDGIWQGDGRRYHVVGQPGGVEIFALADSRGGLDRPMTGATRRSASVAQLHREGDRLVGHGQQFRGHGDRVCRVRWPIAARCEGGRLELAISEPGALVSEDLADCSQAPATGEPRRLVLRRLRAL